MISSAAKRLRGLLLVALVCQLVPLLGCTRNVYRWTHGPTDAWWPAEAFYIEQADRDIIVINERREGRGLPPEDYRILICHPRENRTPAGLAVIVSPRLTPAIGRLRVLDGELLVINEVSHGIEVRYAGEVTGRSTFDEGSDLQLLGIRVCAIPRNDSAAHRIVDETVGLLHSEPYAREFLRCAFSHTEDQEH
jgi:hypothetical protein